MPELPEVETIVRDLRGLVTGATIADAEVLKPDLIEGEVTIFAEGVRTRRIAGVDRRAKNILIDLGDDLLVINLGMTGRVLVVEKDAQEPTHLGARFHLTDHRRILYQDVRRFGRLELVSKASWSKRDAALGVEPLSDDFTPEFLKQLAAKSRVAVKTWLMDQARVVGIGNIYASEALFRARINPKRPANRLTRAEAERLRDAVREVLTEAIDFRGTTLLDYRDAAGQKGAFSKRLRVYDRCGEPCVNCGTPIERIVQGGRSTFFCPSCQKR